MILRSPLRYSATRIAQRVDLGASRFVMPLANVLEKPNVMTPWLDLPTAAGAKILLAL